MKDEIIDEEKFITDCVLHGYNGKMKENPYVLGRNIYYKQSGNVYDLLDFYFQNDKYSKGEKVAKFLILNPFSQDNSTRYICAFTNILRKNNSENKVAEYTLNSNDKYLHNTRKEIPEYVSEFPMRYPNEIYCEKEIPQIISNRIDSKLLDVIKLLRGVSNPDSESLKKLLIIADKVETSSKLVTDDIFCKISDRWLQRWTEIIKANEEKIL